MSNNGWVQLLSDNETYPMQYLFDNVREELGKLKNWEHFILVASPVVAKDRGLVRYQNERVAPIEPRLKHRINAAYKGIGSEFEILQKAKGS